MKITSAIVCDDIRQESNGKAFLIGVYVDEIVALELPLEMNISFFVQAKIDNETEIPLEVRTIRDDGIVFITQDIDFKKLKPDSTITMVFGGTPARFERAGSISLQYKLPGGGWEPIVTKRFLVAPNVINKPKIPDA